jgi:hypothetical protein
MLVSDKIRKLDLASRLLQEADCLMQEVVTDGELCYELHNSIENVHDELSEMADILKAQEAATMPAGRYYIGDLCYVIDDNEVWSEVCSFMFQYNRETKQEENHEGQFTLKDGRTLVIYGTRYGDGTYSSNVGTSHSVDAGVIGAMLESQCDTKYEHIAELGAFIDFSEPWTHSGSGGSRRDWDGVIRLGHVEIQT